MQRLTLVGDDWNTTFRAGTASGEVHSVRVYLPDRRSDDEIRTEVAWLEALSIDGVARVPDPIRAQGGSPFVRAGAGEASRRVAIFRWVPGDKLGDDPRRT